MKPRDPLGEALVEVARNLPLKKLTAAQTLVGLFGLLLTLFAFLLVGTSTVKGIDALVVFVLLVLFFVLGLYWTTRTRRHRR